MEKRERVKAILGISLLYIIVTSIFSLISKVCSFIISQNSSNAKLSYFLQSNLLWIFTVAVIIIALILYLKKWGKGLREDLFDHSLIRVTAGLLIALDGIINLSGIIPVYATSIQSAIQSSQTMQQSMQRMITELIVSDVTSVFILACQILVGIWLIKFYKSKEV